MENGIERIWFTRNEGSEGNQGDHCPKVVPPEGAPPETEEDSNNGDRSRHEEEGQGGICDA